MNRQEQYTRVLVLCLLVIGAAATRALPLLLPGFFAWNFTAVGALCVFAGAQFKNKALALVVPMTTMALSDLFLGNGFDPIVYASFLLMVVCGIAINNKKTVMNIGLASITGAVLFYLITNLTFVYTTSLYPHNMQGVITSYVQALPFLRNMLIGDAIYGVLLFGGFYLLERRYPKLTLREQPVRSN